MGARESWTGVLWALGVLGALRPRWMLELWLLRVRPRPWAGPCHPLGFSVQAHKWVPH